MGTYQCFDIYTDRAFWAGNCGNHINWVIKLNLQTYFVSSLWKSGSNDGWDSTYMITTVSSQKAPCV